MQNVDAINAGIDTSPKMNYLTNGSTLRSWLLTKDHKRIALMYLISVSVFFFMGGLYAAAIRLELLTPSSDLLESGTYNKVFTQHGILMIFFFLIPSIPAILGNFLLPLMIGAKDLALPRINLLSLYIYWVGGAFTLFGLMQGGVDTGWTFYTPYSTTFSNSYVMAVGLGIFINGFSSILTGLNFIVTIHTMRAPGMTWFRLPLFVWAALCNKPRDDPRYTGGCDHDPDARSRTPWPRRYLRSFDRRRPDLVPALVLVLFASGRVHHDLAGDGRDQRTDIKLFAKKIFGYEFIAFSSIAIAVFGFLVWGHHMFVSGQSMYAGLVFSFLTMVVAVPSAIKMFNWTATLYKGSILFNTPMLYAMGFMGLFLVGGLTGLFLGSIGLTVHLTDTYFVVAHFHYVMVGGQVIAYLGGIHYWWPKITGRMYSEFWGKISAMLVFVGFNLTFFPQFILGYQGMPRRYASYPDELQVLNIFSTAGASVLGIGLIMPVIYLGHSLIFGKKAGDNPWMLPGLEWRTSSPPPTENFETMPVVTWEAYDFSDENGLDLDEARRREAASALA